MNTSLHDQIIHSTEFNLINSPAFYDCVVHMICYSGHGTITYNGSQFHIGADCIAIITSPRSITDIESSSDFTCEYIVAPEEYLHSLLPANNYSIIGRVSLFENPIIHVTGRDASTFKRDIENIVLRYRDSDHMFYKEMMGGLIRTMIYDLFHFHAVTNRHDILTTDRVGYVTHRFFSMIQEGMPGKHREPAYYADKLHVSVKYLSETIKRITGKNVSAHINHAAVSIIISYLNDTYLSITQIADEMNFSSVNYFSRYCTKHMGISPAQYRTVNVRNNNSRD